MTAPVEHPDPSPTQRPNLPPSVPGPVRTAVAEVLADLPADRATAFEVRLHRWWVDLVGGLEDVHEPAIVADLARRLAVVAATGFRDRPDDLHRLDQRRLVEPDWLQSPRMVGYAAYTERFAGDLAGVADRVGYLEELGVTYLHLMPLLAPRDGEEDGGDDGGDDGGYAVVDYRRVRPDLGSMDDLRDLATALRGRGISLVLDLVLNHVADDHEWARRARAGDDHHRAFFHTFEDRTLPDAYEATLPEVFPAFAPGNFTFDDDLDAWVWTTFNRFQWDLDWSNPDVLVAFVDIVLFLANVGVEVLRLDAIAFLWKRLGTTCQGEPEVHDLTRVLRAIVRMACPALAFKAEAIVGPRDLVQYLGRGRYVGKVSDLAYHNSLMVQAWSMLATGEVGLAARALSELPPAPPTATWITYVRCHDDIGWAIDDGDAAAVGVTGHGHRSFLADFYTGDFPGSTARGLTFQENPDTGDRRTCGTAASLVGLDAAEQSEDSRAVTRALARLHLAHALVYGWGGIPVVWSGDELGQPNDPDWADDPRHADDNRWAHRPALDPERMAARRDAATVPGQVFADLAHLAEVRAGLPHLHASVTPWIGPVDDPGVLVVGRDHPLGRMIAVHNVATTPRPWPGHRVHELGMADAVDALTGRPVPWGADGDVWVPPLAVLWLVADD